MQNRNRLTDRENHLTVTKGERGWRKDWEFGVSRHRIAYIGWINKPLLSSTGNYNQYPMINHNGKEYEKEYRRSHRASGETNPTSIHEDTDLIPGFAQWVKDLVLP